MARYVLRNEYGQIPKPASATVEDYFYLESILPKLSPESIQIHGVGGNPYWEDHIAHWLDKGFDHTELPDGSRTRKMPAYRWWIEVETVADLIALSKECANAPICVHTYGDETYLTIGNED